MVAQTSKRLPLLVIVASLLVVFAGLLISPFSGIAFAKSDQVKIQHVATVPKLGNYSLPSWWNGKTCDGDNYFRAVRVHSFLLTSWRGIQVCGPLPNTVSTHDNPVAMPGSTEQEFECTELVKRYLYLAYGLRSLSGTYGYQVVDNYTNKYPDKFRKIVNDGYTAQAPQIGDVLSYGATSRNPFGHTSIVTDSHVDSKGYGSINVIEQNIPGAKKLGEATLQVGDWVIQPDRYHIGQVSSWMTPINTSGSNGSNIPRLTSDCGHLKTPWVALYSGINYSGTQLCFEGRGIVNLYDYFFAGKTRSVNIAANVTFSDNVANTVSFGYGYQTGNLGSWNDRIVQIAIRD